MNKLCIRNFQRHSNLVIELDPNITTIVGESDVGKSSIIRALRWLTLNKPSGESFLKKGENLVRVTLELDESVISRKRGKVNIYSLDGEEFKAIGTGVPEEISKLLNMSDLNFQCQHDSPFWFMLSPGEVSRELNSIINLGLIDSTLYNISSELRHSKSTVNFREERLATALFKKNSLNWCKEADIELVELELIEDKISVVDKERENLLELTEEIQDVYTFTETCSQSVKELNKVLTIGQQLTDTTNKLDRLGYLVDEIEKCEKIAGIKIPTTEINSLDNLEKQWIKVGRDKSYLSQLISQITRTQDEICQLNEEISDIVNHLEKETRGKCPLCGNLLDQKLL